jgi:hypothetical protein|tara:strand:+ start:120 stop:323 length:204 start_codon:yes stop_codon:yes gene_type:complete
MKTAIVYDECGSDWAIECSDDTTVEELKARYPEIQFRYWEQYSAREMAEWRLRNWEESHDDWYEGAY